MIYDLIRVGTRYHLVPRGSAQEGKFVATVSERVARENGWL